MHNWWGNLLRYSTIQKAPLCKGDERGGAASGAHEGRRQWRKQAVVSPVGTGLRRAQCAKQAKRKSNEQRRLASGSVARRLLRIVGTEEHRKRAPRTAEARRAGVASTRSKAQCAATEHRASEAQSGAKTRGDYAELRSVNPSVAAAPRHLPFPFGKKEAFGRATSYDCATNQMAPLCKGSCQRS